MDVHKITDQTELDSYEFLAQTSEVKTEDKNDHVDESQLKTTDDDWKSSDDCFTSNAGFGCPFKSCESILVSKHSLKDHFQTCHQVYDNNMKEIIFLYSRRQVKEKRRRQVRKRHGSDQQNKIY